MCIRPISIKNTKLHFDVRIDKASLQVPCGHCWQCDLQKKNSWRARAIAEYLAYASNGFSVFYYTLTFNDEHLPHYHGMPCFDKKLVQKFLKRIRFSLTHEINPVNFKYILTSEFGDKFGRPHHHVMFFLNTAYDSHKFYKLIEKNWAKGRYNFGFIEPGDYNGVVNSSQAVDYVTKYITKSSYFEYEKFKNIYESNLANFTVVDEDSLSQVELQANEDSKQRENSLYKNSLPFHLQSVGFGRYLDNYVTNDNLLRNTVTLPTYKGIKDFPIPLYTLRHFCYDSEINEHGNISYVLNSLGQKIKLAKSDTCVNASELALQETFKMVNDFSLSSHPILSKLFSNVDDFQEHIFYLLNGATFRDVAIYSMFYRGYTTDCILGFQDFKKDLQTLFNSRFEDTWPLLKDFDFVSVLPRFKDFDEILFLFDCVLQLATYSKYLESILKFNALQMQYHKPKLLTPVTLNEFCDGKF